MRLCIPLQALFFVYASAVLPKGWKSCRRSDPNFTKCLKEQISVAAHSIIHGDKRLGSDPLDPLTTEDIFINNSVDKNAPVAVKLTFENMKSTGAENFTLTHLETDFKTGDATIHIPNLKTNGQYKVDGKVLLLPIVGQGNFQINWIDHDLHLHIVWKKVNKDGKEYFQFGELVTYAKPGKLAIRMENLFNGNKALGETMNTVLNDNWDILYEELKPSIDNALSVSLARIANKILSRIPAQEIDVP